MAQKCSTDQRFIWKRNTTYKIDTLGPQRLFEWSGKYLSKKFKFGIKFQVST